MSVLQSGTPRIDVMTVTSRTPFCVRPRTHALRNASSSCSSAITTCVPGSMRNVAGVMPCSTGASTRAFAVGRPSGAMYATTSAPRKRWLVSACFASSALSPQPTMSVERFQRLAASNARFVNALNVGTSTNAPLHVNAHQPRENMPLVSVVSAR
jgi:hypothetical protein